LAKEVETEGIVLRSQTTGEDDLLVDFLTPDQGRLRGYARHGRKSRKRFGTVLEPLNILRIRYRDGGKYASLEEAVLERPLNRFRSDLNSAVGAFYLLDLVRETIHERNPDSRLYTLLRDSLIRLNDGFPLREVLRDFEFRFLDFLGYRPHLAACLACGREQEGDGKFFFVFREGGIFCAACLPRGVPFAPYAEESLHEILSRFLEYQIGRPLKSHKFLTGEAFSG